MGCIKTILKTPKKSGTFENCEVTCAIWEEIFEDIDDALKDLKATDDIIKSDLTRLSIDNVEQNKRLETVENATEDTVDRLDNVEKYANEETADRLNITELEIDNLQDKYDLLSSQTKIFESSIETIEARLDILEKNLGTSPVLLLFSNYS